MPPETVKELSGLPHIEVPFSEVQRHFSGQVVALMDELQNSKAKSAKGMQPKDFKWFYVYKRANDPPEFVTNPQEFTVQVTKDSRHWLNARGKGWQGFEELSIVPEKVLVTYESRAKLICNARQEAKRKAAEVQTAPEIVNRLIAERKDGDDSDGEFLMEAFEEWVESHDHDKRIESIVRVALNQLIQSGE